MNVGLVLCAIGRRRSDQWIDRRAGAVCKSATPASTPAEIKASITVPAILPVDE